MKVKNSKQLLIIFLLMLTLTSFALTSNEVIASEPDPCTGDDPPPEPTKPVQKPPGSGLGGPGNGDPCDPS
ncbi:MAG: hypothetical protein ACW981_02555 [Candidatus Hodarchaeales archaeon]|jgi:hypothetical protein